MYLACVIHDMYKVSTLGSHKEVYVFPCFCVVSVFFLDSFALKRSPEHKTSEKKPVPPQAVVKIVESIPPFLVQYSDFYHSESLFESSVIWYTS